MYKMGAPTNQFETLKTHDPILMSMLDKSSVEAMVNVRLKASWVLMNSKKLIAQHKNLMI